jgi:hypothetical protein
VILVIEYAGWCVLRLATDPDPTDEPRGSSGYTFAFGDEPDLDRVLRLQPSPGLPLRSHAPQIGVTVTKAERTTGAGAEGTDVPALAGASVDLLEEPKFENRNWVLTLPGFEPIVPFHLEIAGDGVSVRREAPLNLKDTAQPAWEASAEALAAQAAHGMEYEPQTVGRATGIWDGVQVVEQRLAQLKDDRAHAADGSAEAAVLDGRIAELALALEKNATEGGDRRIGARFGVERFAFAMEGASAIVGDPEAFGGELDDTAPWTISFWMGAWDPDLLCLYMQGSLEIPYR